MTASSRRPAVCERRRFGVSRAMAGSSPVRTAPIGASSATLPSYARVTSAVAVNIFVVEPRRNNISGRTGAPVSTSATPTLVANTMRSPSTKAMAAPGVRVSCSSWRKTSTIGSKGEVGAWLDDGATATIAIADARLIRTNINRSRVIFSGILYLPIDGGHFLGRDPEPQRVAKFVLDID